MKYYMLEIDHSNPEAYIRDYSVVEHIFENSLDGTSLSSYPIAELQVANISQKKNDILIGFSLNYVVSSRLKKIIEDSGLEPNLEFLSVIINGEGQEDYWFMQPLNNVQCLDMDKSEYSRPAAFLNLPQSRVKKIKKFVVEPDKVVDRHLFRPDQPKVKVFISDKMVSIFEENDVTGYELRLLDPFGEWQ